MTLHATAPVLDEVELADLIGRHRAFWHRDPVDGPLVSYSKARYGGDKPVPGEAVSITPETILSRSEATVSSLGSGYERRGTTHGDLFNSSPFPTPPWMEAVLGCPIKVFVNTSTDWREPLPGGWDAVRQIQPGMGGPWRDALLDVVTRASRELGHKYPLGNPLIRAPIDCLAAMVGDEALCYLLFDEPDEIKRVADICADIWLELTASWLDVAVPFAGGHFNQMGLWAPGTTNIFTVDASTLLSPAQYREIFLDRDARLAGGVEYPLIHVHAEACHQVEGWLGLPNLAIQIDDGHILVEDGWTFQKSWPELLAVYRKVQEAGHPLLLHLTAEHFAEARVTLDPRGLAYSVTERIPD